MCFHFNLILRSHTNFMWAFLFRFIPSRSLTNWGVRPIAIDRATSSMIFSGDNLAEEGSASTRLFCGAFSSGGGLSRLLFINALMSIGGSTCIANLSASTTGLPASFPQLLAPQVRCGVSHCSSKISTSTGNVKKCYSQRRIQYLYSPKHQRWIDQHSPQPSILSSPLC